MPAYRFYYEHLPAEGALLHLDGVEFHHLYHVMRHKEGESIEFVDGKGCLCLAKIEKIEKKRAILCIEKRQMTMPSTFNLVLMQAIPRANRLDFIIEKGTELGMTELWLFPSQHSERKIFSEEQLQRMKGVAIAAMKQCGRLYLPKIVMKPKMEQWQELPYPSFYGDTSPTAPSLLNLIQSKPLHEGIILCIGPESGFTTEESSQLEKIGAKGVKLHENILRTDTAAIASLAIVSAAI